MNHPAIDTYLARRLDEDHFEKQVTYTDASTEYPCEIGSRNYGYLKTAESDLSPKDQQYLKALAQQLAALLHSKSWDVAIAVDQKIAEMHRASSLHSWTGIYVKSGSHLTIACYRGPYTPHSVIPIAEGICGAAVREGKTLNIPDVKADPRYLSCDFLTKSEIVVPIFSPTGEAIAEIDIDSHELAAFSDAGRLRLEETARELAPLMLQLFE